MFEAISLIVFAFVMYFCLVVAPTIVEYMGTVEFKESFFKHLHN